MFIALPACSLVLVLFLNFYAIVLSFIGALLTLIYPFMKRYTHLPQLFLGMAFGWSIPMAYGVTIGQLPLECWILFIANLAWTVAYDTQYAMVDRDDDLRIGVKSTAILFAQYDNKIITLLQLITLGLLCWLGNLNYFHVSYFLMLGVVTLFFIYQCRLIKHRKREDCFSAFLNNNYFGMMVFVAHAVRFIYSITSPYFPDIFVLVHKIKIILNCIYFLYYFFFIIPSLIFLILRK